MEEYAVLLEETQDRLRPVHNAWGWEKLSFLDYLPPQGLDRAEGETEDAHERRIRRREERAGFARGRLAAIQNLMKFRHGGPCTTDAAEACISAALPFVVEAAEITGRSAFITGMAWVRRWCPAYAVEIGMEGVAGLVGALLDHRDTEQDRQGDGPWVQWLPEMSKLVEILMPTFAEVTTLKMKGWGSIDRPDDDALRDRATTLRREKRRNTGTRSQSERTKTKDMEVLAAELGISLSTLKRRMRKAKGDPNLSAPSMGKYGSDILGSRPAASNDDVPDLNQQIRENGYHGRNLIMEPWMVEQAIKESPEIAGNLAESFAAVDAMLETVEMPELRPPTEIGFYGQNITMSAWEVRMAVERHPALNDDLADHLDAIDALMAKTLPDYRKRVSRNLLADRNRIALRRRRMHAQAGQTGVAA